MIASASSWIEGEALRQLEATANLPHMVRVVGLPDLHPGRGTPVGAAFLTRDVVYPHLVGSDIGCGMGLWSTGLAKRAARRDKWAKTLRGLESPWEGDSTARLAARSLPNHAFAHALGTIGHGNHFAELVSVERVVDHDAWNPLGVREDELFLLVHSGSRSLGEHILRSHTSVHGNGSLVARSTEGQAYLAAHDAAVRFAEENRALIAERFLDGVGGNGARLFDIVHNHVAPVTDARGGGFLHRKGAAPHDVPFVVIPGSRGSFSYIVAPAGDGARSGWSLAHGAGRKWTRSNARERVRATTKRSSLEQTQLGSRVICENLDLLYEEAPQAYKDISRVIADLVEHGVARVVAILRPVLTYKTRVAR